MIKVLVADDNEKFNLSLSNFLTKENDIKIIGMCLDGKTALDLYLRMKPDVLLLDLEIPKINGIEIINYLNGIDSEKGKTNIIVISGNSDLRATLSNFSKVYYSFKKPCDLNLILRTIREMHSAKKSVNELEKNLYEFFQKMNFNMNSIGTMYLIEIILTIYKNPTHTYNLKKLLHEIAEKNSTQYLAVKSAVYHSVDSMNRFIDKETLNTFYPYCKGRKITPYDIINYLKLEFLKEAS